MSQPANQLSYLLVADRELALGLLVLLCEGLQLFHRLALQDRYAELDVRLGVLVAGLQGKAPTSAPGRLMPCNIK